MVVDFGSCCCFLKEELAFFFVLFGANVVVARDEADLTEVAKTGKEKEEEEDIVVVPTAGEEMVEAKKNDKGEQKKGILGITLVRVVVMPS